MAGVDAGGHQTTSCTRTDGRRGRNRPEPEPQRARRTAGEKRQDGSQSSTTSEGHYGLDFFGGWSIHRVHATRGELSVRREQLAAPPPRQTYARSYVRSCARLRACRRTRARDPVTDLDAGRGNPSEPP